MQPNEIVLSVDVANNGTTVNLEYTQSALLENRSTYMSGIHSIDRRDLLQLYRTAPTKQGNFKGVAKTAVKFTKDFLVFGVDGVSSLTAPVIIEVGFSIPVGVSSGDITEMRQRAVALLDLDAVMTPLNFQQLI